MFEESKFIRLAQLEQSAAGMLEIFHRLLEAKEYIRRFPGNGNKFNSLEVAKIDECTIEATYLYTTVRFQLVFGYNKHNRPNARVVCLHKYVIFDKTHYDILGEFGFDWSGETVNLGVAQDGSMRTIPGGADEIVTAYLDLAIERGPSRLTAQ